MCDPVAIGDLWSSPHLGLGYGAHWGPHGSLGYSHNRRERLSPDGQLTRETLFPTLSKRFCGAIGHRFYSYFSLKTGNLEFQKMAISPSNQMI